MFDVFYIDNKPPGLFVHERAADSIQHAQDLSRTRYFWIVTYLANYTGWDFLWEPPPWQSHQRHAWPSQWQKDCGTYLIPRGGYQDTNYHRDRMILRRSEHKNWRLPENAIADFDYSWHPDPTDPPYIYQFGSQHQKTGGPQYVMPDASDIKYVDQLRASVLHATDTIYVIDHLDGRAASLASHLSAHKTVRYFDNYLDTLRRVAKNALSQQQEFIWIVSSVCDYADFDFSWHPEQWQSTMLHVFPSGNQKFGDTFFMHVPTFVSRSEHIELLEWSDLNFVTDHIVRRHPMPTICHHYDSQIDAIKNTNWCGPVALLAADGRNSNNTPIIPLWRKETKTVMPLSRGGSLIVVPKEVAAVIKKQVYDYQWIDRSCENWIQDRPLDIVFIANGEHGAEHHWNILQNALAKHMARNQLHRVDGVNGRVAAYQAAAGKSHTPWFFAVFAKLQVNEDFDWTWQPDRMQQAKHYIFHAYNPVNHLVYGHQAMIAYNVKLVMNNQGQGLDFTLDDPHEVVPIVSGTAYYDNDAWTCWRTAFREVIKLRHSLPDVENEYRLSEWLRENTENDFVKWSHIGAQDAMRYYDEVKGDFDAIKKTYEWAWLASYAMMIHPELVTQSRA